MNTDRDVKCILNENSLIINKYSKVSSNSTSPDRKNKKKKQKPLSMNDSTLNKIYQDSMKARNLKIPQKNIFINNNDSMSSLTSITSTNKCSSNKAKGQNLHNSKIKNLNLPIKNIKFGIKNINNKVKNNSFNGMTGVSPSNLPLPQKLKKNPSNGLNNSNSYKNIFSKNENAFLNSKTEMFKINQTQPITYSSLSTANNINQNSARHNTMETLRLNEELLQYKLNNSKLSNEINILSEKVNTLKGVISIKDSENKMLHQKYAEAIEEYNLEIEKIKKLNIENHSFKLNNEKSTEYIKSTLSILIELLEMFIAPRMSSYTRQSFNVENISASYSMDIYDSYNNDDERRNTIIDQIQGLLVSKLNMMKKNLNMDIDQEIEKVKNWNSKSIKDDINISNLNLKNSKLNESNESLKKSISNDFFDMSTSNQFITGVHSPKFNNNDLSVAFKLGSMSIGKKESKDENSNVFNNLSLKKEDDNLMLNDSFLKILKQSNSYLI
jgi:hypothetical protein